MYIYSISFLPQKVAYYSLFHPRGNHQRNHHIYIYTPVYKKGCPKR